MAIQTINIGAQPNDKTGDSARDGMAKVNGNFAELDTRTAAAQAKADAALPLAQKGAANGVAPLGADQKVPAANLPSYVDDVLEFATLGDFPATGESGKIYIAVNGASSEDPSRQYRWSGSTYTEIEPSPGSTDAVPEGSINKYYTDDRVLVQTYSKVQLDAITTGKVSRVPVATMQGYTTDHGIIAAPSQGLMEFDGTNRYITVDPGHGQCQLTYVSPTLLRLRAMNGNGLYINGRRYKISAAGVDIANSLFTAGGGRYYLYAKDDGSGGIAPEAAISTAVHSQDSRGVEIKTGDGTRTFLGSIYLNSSGQFQDDYSVRGVLSWFNQPSFSIALSASTSVGNGSTPLGSAGILLYFAKDIVNANMMVAANLSVAGAALFGSMYKNAAQWSGQSAVTAAGAGYAVSFTSDVKEVQGSDGAMSIQAVAATNSGLATVQHYVYAHVVPGR